MNNYVFSHMNDWKEEFKISLAPSAAYAKDTVLQLSMPHMTIFFTPDQLRDLRDLLVNSSLLDTPADAPEPECTCQQTDVDMADARGCELHGGAR